MINDQVVLSVERLRDALGDLKQQLRQKYRGADRQVTATDIRETTARVAESWLVELATVSDVAEALGPAALADLTVHFQRLLTFAEHASLRSRYDKEIKSILKDFGIKVVIPLKQRRGHSTPPPAVGASQKDSALSVFVGQSFAPRDKVVNDCVLDTLGMLGVPSVTGDKPKADSIAVKVKNLIEEHPVFCGVFTRRDKIARKPEWTTSSWVIDEKAYALGRQKKLILLKEEGVGSIGGIQGDYEYIEFSRTALHDLILKVAALFHVTNSGFRK
jgi:hypothetical protein